MARIEQRGSPRVPARFAASVMIPTRRFLISCGRLFAMTMPWHSLDDRRWKLSAYAFSGRLDLVASWLSNLFDACRKVANWKGGYNKQCPHSSLVCWTSAGCTCAHNPELWRSRGLSSQWKRLRFFPLNPGFKDHVYRVRGTAVRE